MTATSDRPLIDVCKALGDPMRWAILQRAAATSEVACQELDDLPVSKPTISYHLKILQQAGLITVRKAGRSYYYSLEHEAIHQLQDALWALAPSPHPVAPGEPPYISSQRWRHRRGAANARSQHTIAHRGLPEDDGDDAVVLTW
jgi:DNA-binding transcriptional ArsR family regulator